MFVVLDSFIWIKLSKLLSPNISVVCLTECVTYTASLEVLRICPGPVSTVNEIVPSHNKKKKILEV